MTDAEYRFLLSELSLLRGLVAKTEEIRAEVAHIRREIEKMSSDVNQGLAALQQAEVTFAQAVADNTAAEQAIVDEVATLAAKIAALTQNSEDESVAAAAADMVEKIAVLQANTKAMQDAVAAQQPPPPAPVSAQETAAHAQSADIAGAATEEPFKPDTGVSEPKEAGKVHFH